MSDIKRLTQKINKWLRDRNWERFQTPKDLAISVSLEAAEILEHFQWKNGKVAAKHIADNKEEIADEIADVAIYLFKLADKVDVDLAKAMEEKLKKSAKKYPVAKVKKDRALETYYKIKKTQRIKRRK